jgi:hypothetical protein
MQHRNNGPALPAFVSSAGRAASESYILFFDQQSRGSASNYRSIARRFFRWAEEQHLSLQSVRQEHVQRFHSELLEEAGPNMQYTSFSVLRRLFQHMHEQGALVADPADGVRVECRPRFKAVRGAFCDQWGYGDDDELTQAAMVMVAPACIATFSLKAIRAYTQYPVSTVEAIAKRLYDKGIWERENCIRCEWLDPECEHLDFAILLDAFVVVGRFDRNEKLQYSLPKERYERRNAESDEGAAQFEVTRTAREERREVVTVREVSETVVERRVE